MSESKKTDISKQKSPFAKKGLRPGDLEKYRLLAIELGASDAKIIKSNQVIIEHRVLGKCKIPMCVQYGMSMNCPPHAPTPDEVRKMVKEYRYGVFIRLIIPSVRIAGAAALEGKITAIDRRKINEIVAEVESQAFYEGHYLAMGFAGGSCRSSLCNGLECSALTTKNGCRHGLKARPSMEGVGMNVFQMARNMGWEIHPIGRRTLPDEIPHGNRLGLVMIA